MSGKYLRKGDEQKKELKSIRYEKFARCIEGIHKSINKLKVAASPSLGVKGVHVFWIYKLLEYPDGLTAAEIAKMRSEVREKQRTMARLYGIQRLSTFDICTHHFIGVGLFYPARSALVGALM